jgi:ketosteroid isomerase-like protein
MPALRIGSVSSGQVKEDTVESNVKIYESLLEDFNRDGVAGVLPYFSDDIEIYDPDLPEGTYRGRAALVQVLQQFVAGSESTQVQNWELLAAGDRVVALTHVYSRGEGGDPVVEWRDAHTMTFRDGKVIYWRLYLDRAEALADAGLDPELARDSKR